MVGIKESVNQHMTSTPKEITNLKTELLDNGCFETKGRIDEVSRICSNLLEHQDYITSMVCDYLERIDWNNPKCNSGAQEPKPSEQDADELEGLIFRNAEDILISKKCISGLLMRNKQLRRDHNDLMEKTYLLQEQVTSH